MNHSGARALFRTAALSALLLAGRIGTGSDGPAGALADYLSRAAGRDAVVAAVEARFGKPVPAFTGEDGARFLAGLGLSREEDLFTWSHVTGIPVIAVGPGRKFFRSNSHLPSEEARAAETRPLEVTGQVRHHVGFAEDRTSLPALGPWLVPLREVPYLAEVGEALRSLPWPVVAALRGKAIYLTLAEGGRCEAVWHPVGTELEPEYAGMQPGVFVAAEAGGATADSLVRCLGRMLFETVLEGRYFGLYAYPLQFPGFQALKPDRRRIFGRRRARPDGAESFAEHFRAFVREREAFLARAGSEGMEKYRFMERLTGSTPTTMERLRPEHVARVDAARQREVLAEYLRRQGEREAAVARLTAEYGKPFPDFGEADYARFMASLDLDRDDDLWDWSHFTGIPLAGLSRRSTTFHVNAHLAADAEAANLLPYPVLTKLVSSFDEKEERVRVTLPDGRPLPLRDLPGGMVMRTDVTGGVVHNRGFVPDRICYEALEPYLVALADLEDREEIGAGIRTLPLSIVKAYRGKALYPTDCSRTGWAVTWRVGNDRTLSYAGMMSGSFVERRRDPARSPFPPEELVARGEESLRGSAADSLVHEVGHVIDHSVVGGREGVRSFPDQFPAFQELLPERDLAFGPGDRRGPQTSFGYVSRYARTNGQEDFAESFWAFVRDRGAFLARARAEEAEGHPELMRKCRFMEKLVDHTPATAVPLSAELLVRPVAAAAAPDPAAALAEYVAAEGRKAADVAGVEKAFGKPLSRFTAEEYARFMAGLDLDRDEDLFLWSHAADIPILSVRKSSGFFYVNLHLLKDEARADSLLRAAVKSDLDPETGALRIRTGDGETLPIRDLPAGVIQATGRTGRLWYLEGFGDDRVVPEALGPYLVRLKDVDYRAEIGAWIRSLPLPAVQVLRGKGLFFTTVTGRSYAVGMPCSNTTYRIFVGLETGVYVDPRHDGPAGTFGNFVHEFGHLVDYVVMKGGYGTFRHSLQFAEFRKTVPEKEMIFGAGDDPVPPTPFGYVSRYARTNAQENFAEHFRAFVLERERFRGQAAKEAEEGHPELMEKYRFMEVLIERTPTTLRRLSPEFLEEEEAWTEQGARLSRLLRARRLLGDAAPASLAALVEETRGAAFAGRAAREKAEASFEKALGRVLEDVERLRDRELAESAAKLLSGVSLEVGLAPDATSGRPVLTATLRGADPDGVEGTVTFDTSPAGRFGAAATVPVRAGAGESPVVSWEPDAGSDLGPFVARAVAELRWRGRRLVLFGEAACRPTIPVWWTVGPFPNPGGAPADVAHPPEAAPVDLAATYPGAEGRVLAWKEVRRDPSSPAGSEFVVDLDAVHGEGKEAAAYAAVRVHSDAETDAVLSLGSADGVVAWVNRERVLAWLGGRRNYASGSNRAPIRLRKGANELLVKITVAGDGWKFAASILDGRGRPLPGIRFGAGD